MSLKVFRTYCIELIRCIQKRNRDFIAFSLLNSYYDIATLRKSSLIRHVIQSRKLEKINEA